MLYLGVRIVMEHSGNKLDSRFVLRWVAPWVVLGSIFLLAVAAPAQLVQPKTAADSIDLSGASKTPLVYSNSPAHKKNRSAKEATAEMDSREFSNDSTVGTLIGVGAEFVGDVMKGMLSPNSAETDAVELERTRR